jgi:hypothetical protein
MSNRRKILWVICTGPGLILLIEGAIKFIIGAIESPSSLRAGAIISLLTMLISILYFLPSFIADQKKQQNFSSILIMNLFLGWSIIGWVLALTWAFSNSQQAHSKEIENGAIDQSKLGNTIGNNVNELKNCPYCAEVIKIEAIKCKHCGSQLLPT